RQEQARLALLDNQPMQALVYLHDAVSAGADNPLLRRLAGVTDYLMRGDKGVVARMQQGVAHLPVSPDGKYIAVVSDDSRVAIFEAAHPERQHTADTGVACGAGAFSSTRFFSGCNDGKLRVIDPATGTIEKTIFVGAGVVWSIVVVDDGK